MFSIFNSAHFGLVGPNQWKYHHKKNTSLTRLTKIHTSASSTWKAKVPSESVLAILQNVRTLSIYPRKFSSSTRSTHCHQNSLWLTVITIIIAKSVRQQLTLVKVKSKIFKLNTWQFSEKLTSSKEWVILPNGNLCSTPSSSLTRNCCGNGGGRRQLRTNEQKQILISLRLPRKSQVFRSDEPLSWAPAS